jgi:cytidylate kinase
MACSLSDVVHEQGAYWVLRVPTGFEVYRNTGTHSVRCARIGFKGAKGLQRAKDEIARREASA